MPGPPEASGVPSSPRAQRRACHKRGGQRIETRDGSTRFQVLYCFLSLYHSINQSVQTPTQTYQQSNVISCSQSFCTRGSDLAPAQGACLMSPSRSPECAKAEVSRDRRRVAPPGLPGPQGSQQSRLCWIHPQSQSRFRTDETLPVLKEAVLPVQMRSLSAGLDTDKLAHLKGLQAGPRCPQSCYSKYIPQAQPPSSTPGSGIRVLGSLPFGRSLQAPQICGSPHPPTHPILQDQSSVGDTANGSSSSC